MKVQLFFLIFCVAVNATVDDETVDEPSLPLTILIQPLTANAPAPSTLAQIVYSASSLASSISSYAPPEISSSLLRIGTTAGSSTTSSPAFGNSTTLTSAEIFEKGYRPTIIVWLDGNGDVVSVSCKSDKIDAGASRDFGPRIIVERAMKGRGPELNRPVVLKEGKVEVPVPEKTLLQKYVS